jgi:hypothetical protein
MRAEARFLKWGSLQCKKRVMCFFTVFHPESTTVLDASIIFLYVACPRCNASSRSFCAGPKDVLGNESRYVIPIFLSLVFARRAIGGIFVRSKESVTTSTADVQASAQFAPPHGAESRDGLGHIQDVHFPPSAPGRSADFGSTAIVWCLWRLPARKLVSAAPQPRLVTDMGASHVCHVGLLHWIFSMLSPLPGGTFLRIV